MCLQVCMCVFFLSARARACLLFNVFFVSLRLEQELASPKKKNERKCVCVQVFERERERWRACGGTDTRVCVYVYVCVCVCVCAHSRVSPTL